MAGGIMSYSPAQWEPCDSYLFGGVDFSANPKTFNNLLGDIYDYRIYITVDGCTSNWGAAMRFNGDSGANYRRYRIQAYGTSKDAAVSEVMTSLGPVFIGSGLSAYRFFTVIDIMGDSSAERLVSIVDSSGDTSTKYVQQMCGLWKNTTDELTSIIISGTNTTLVTGTVHLFRKSKKQIFNSPDLEMVKTVEFSGRNLYSDPIDFNNLLGDSDELYTIEALITTSPVISAYKVYFNNDKTNANYEMQYTKNQNGVLSGLSLLASPWLSNADSDGAMYTCLSIFAKSGSKRLSSILNFSKTQAQQFISANWWGNTADEINSIQIESTVDCVSNGKITLYKRSKKQSTLPSHAQLIERVNVDGDFSAGHTFKNLQGNSDGVYYLRTYLTDKGTDAGIDGITINDDAGTNYNYQHLDSYASSLSANSGAWTGLFYGGWHHSGYPCLCEFWIFAKSGKYRPMLCRRQFCYGDTYQSIYSGSWNNATDEITKIYSFNNSATPIQGTVELYKISLN